VPTYFDAIFAVIKINNGTRLDLFFGTENEGFCILMKLFSGCIAIAMEAENGEI